MIRVFRDFVEDRRISMDVYADGLMEGLKIHGLTHFDVREFVPVAWLGFRGRKSTLGVRLSRYVEYPWQAFRARADIHHIVDHGYAHLLQVLDPTRTVVTVHDIIPILAWKGLIPGLTYPHRPRLIERSLGFLKEARFVVADSENTKRTIMEHCGCRPDQVRVIYCGLRAEFHTVEAREKNALRKQFGLPCGHTQLVLIVGQAPYKNLGGSLRVLARLVSASSRPVKAVRVGQESAEWRTQLDRSGIESAVVDLGPWPNSMIDLYQAVDCVLFPSWYEGFGWPPLEAMACGTPVVTSNVASLPEVVGDAGLMRDPNDIEGLVTDVLAILNDARLRADMIERGRRRASAFTWGRYARQVLSLYEQIV